MSLAPSRQNSQNQTSQRVLHLYNVTAGNAEILFIVAIDPPQAPGEPHTFLLFCKSGKIERKLCRPAHCKIEFDPQAATFEVCLFPKEGFPVNSLFSVRVFLRTDRFQHYLFGHDHFWIGKDPKFHLTWHGSSMMQPVAPINPQTHVLTGDIGGARLAFFVTIEQADPFAPEGAGYESLISLEYECGGVKRYLCRHIAARITCDLSALSFIIYSVPVRTTTSGSIHRLFFWVRSVDLITQRLWKTDDFRVTTTEQLEQAQKTLAIVGVRATQGPLVAVPTTPSSYVSQHSDRFPLEDATPRVDDEDEDDDRSIIGLLKGNSRLKDGLAYDNLPGLPPHYSDNAGQSTQRVDNYQGMSGLRTNSTF
ncbi:hypothetical protein BOTBODRAFT_179997 [Botryobasidium botryosum FD-172 SS1]|uniref:Uncharacterized protein n=1 Tax=Botryobasidium botryosum (strain FD-172 SS1) TaxID=930990 RepID=A0A067LY98_BOTB1|nr:hypothetical protein BOTBODRAFT_179997 [Botryobasidium botryosum FD-172 SS1]